jgi:hypothetical protein
MDNPIFQCLEDVMKHPASSMQWFVLRSSSSR